MTDRTVGSTNVTIDTDCATREYGGCDISVELDDEANFSRSCFAIGEYFYFKVYCTSSFTVRATLGTPSRVDSGVAETLEEYVDFSNWSGSTDKPIYSLTSYEWIGTSLGSLSFLRGSSTLKADESRSYGYGIARVRYKSVFARYRHRSSVEGDIIVYAVGSGSCYDSSGERPTAGITVEVRATCVEDGNNVVLVFRDYKTNEPVVGAQVTVDGRVVGNTDDDGRIYLGYMDGGEHTVRAVATGYTDTQLDGLGNDIFVVSE